ncbi:hypothetical protein LCGC14_1983810, partial [marine sediment metagenome]
MNCNEECEVYSRIVGYLRPVSNWNVGKQEEFRERVEYKIKPPTYIGSGKAKMLADRVHRYEADVVIFDNDLSPGQIRELENIIEVKVLDRSELILDIFATRAKTRQAKLQVELAQLEYTYPRLTR